MKYLETRQLRPNRYFWRTHDQQEIDYLEEAEGQLRAYELKWRASPKKASAAFRKAYPEAEVQWVGTENFESFLL